MVIPIAFQFYSSAASDMFIIPSSLNIFFSELCALTITYSFSAPLVDPTFTKSLDIGDS